MLDTGKLDDAVALDRGKGLSDGGGLVGFVVAELFGPDGVLKARCAVKNLITAAGDNMYVSRGAGVGSPPAAPTGFKLGTGSTAPAKTGAGAALVTYLSGSNKTFDATFPSVAGGVATFKRTYAPGEATTTSAITEAVIVNDAATDATSTAANTTARVLLTGIGSKGAADTLTLTWTHTLLGA